MTTAQYYSRLLYHSSRTLQQFTVGEHQKITAVYCMTAAQYYSSLLYDSNTTLQQFTA
jgi:hypothetical protein